LKPANVSHHHHTHTHSLTPTHPWNSIPFQFHSNSNSRVVHGDLKPENVLTNVSAEVKLTDFGCSKVGEGVRLRLLS
jgi:serine/threonine protein kinase